jgi:hypothetical protein
VKPLLKQRKDSRTQEDQKEILTLEKVIRTKKAKEISYYISFTFSSLPSLIQAIH